jgi:hypothetical protein
MSLTAGQISNSAPLDEQARARLCAAACFATFAIQLWLIWTHVPWLDELQAALLARDTHDLTEWWNNFRYEGHAPLWHLLLKGAQIGVDPLTSLRVVQTLCAVCIFALIVAASPLSWPIRALLCSNYFLFFEYGVIARDYSLGVALMLAAVAFRSHRWSWLFIALVPQAGTQFILIAALLTAMQWRDGRRDAVGLTLAVCGMLGAYALLRPSSDFQALGGLVTQTEESALVTLRYAGSALVPVDLGGRLIGWAEASGVLQLQVLVLAGLLVLPLSQTASRGFGVFAFGIPLFAIATYALSIFVYSLSSRHFGLIVILLVVAAWRYPDRVEANASLRAWLILLSLGSLLSLTHGAWVPFSAAQATARRLAEPDVAGLPIIPVETMAGVEPSAYLGLRTVNVTNQCMQTFVQWKGPVFLPPFDLPTADAASKTQRASDALRILEDTAARIGGDVILLLDPKAEALLARVPSSNVTPVDEIRVGDKLSLHRFIKRLRVPAAKGVAPLPNCTG